MKEKLIERNAKLIDILIRRIERDCPGAVSLVGIYGSFCSGDFHERSDLDLMILLKDDRAWALAKGFILEGIGFDFYCTTWESLESDAAYHSPYLAKLLDSKIVYCPDESDRVRLVALREKARGILSAPLCTEDLERAEKSYGEAERMLSKLMRTEDLVCCRGYICWLLYYLEQAICFLNKSYFRLGTKRVFKELAAMRYVPENYETLVRQLVSSATVADLRSTAIELLHAVDECFAEAGKALNVKVAPKANDLCGTLEEMVSNWRGKILNAAERGDAYAALMTLGSLQSFFDELVDAYDMPRYDAIAAYDPEDLEQTTRNFDSVLEAYHAEYNKVELPVAIYNDIEAFEKDYLSLG